MSSLVQGAELPFDVDTDLKPDDVLERIEKREGEDIDAIKNDEEFDVFLARILQQFEESKEKPDSPESPENDFDTPESPYTPTAPESEQSPDRDEFVHEPENPGNPGAPDFRGDKPSRPSEIDVDTSVYCPRMDYVYSCGGNTILQRTCLKRNDYIPATDIVV